MVTVIAQAKILAAHPEQFGIDLPSYVEGARRLASTGTPYSAELHAGPLENIFTNIGVGYIYPPPLAQLFVPVAGLPLPVLAWAWTLVQAGLLLALLPVVYRTYGGVADRGHLVAILLAAIAFSPNIVALYIGNLSAWIAILVCLMLVVGARGRAASAATAMWLKLTPGVYAVGAVIDKSSRIPALISCATILAVSFVFAPAAWADWVAVLPSIVGLTEAPYTSNLAPPHVLASTGLPVLATIGRVLLPLSFGILLIVTAWKGRLAAWVVASTGVYLTATMTAWDHYFAVLSPLALAAWATASPALRALIVGVLVWFGPLRFLENEWQYHLIGLALWLGFLFGAVMQFSGAAKALRIEGRLVAATGR